MRTGTLVTYVEGPSDVHFFPPIVQKSVDALLETHVEPHSFLDVEVVLVPTGDAPRGRRIFDAVAKDHPGAVIAALHYDATAEPDRQHRHVFDPVRAAWPGGERVPVLIPLAPRREMEAWALADITTLRSAIGARFDTSVVYEGHLLGSVEQLSRPKRTLSELVSQAVRPRRRTPAVTDYLPLIAERLPLESLRRLPSFRAFELSIIDALTELGWTNNA